jgi:hypothetical protein
VADERPLGVVQRWFQAVVTHPDGISEGAAADEAQALIRLRRDELEAVVRRSERLTAAERLSIYANAYYARLLECMGACFPVLQRTLGDDLFDSFAFEYLRRNPSRSYTLDRLGERFPSFLAETRPVRGDGAPADWADFLAELATLELAISQVFDGPGVEGERLLVIEDLRSMSAERFAQATLEVVPCLRLLTFRHPVSAFFTLARSSREGELAVPAPAEERLALTRRDFVVRRYPLDAAQYALLQALGQGHTVAEAIAVAGGASALDDEALAASLRMWFERWTADGFFRRIAG